MYAGREERRYATTSASDFSHGSRVFHGRQMLGPVEVTARHRRQPRVRYPAEDLPLVEELVAIDQPPEHPPVAPETLGRPAWLALALRRVGMRGDDRGARRSGVAHRLGKAAIHRDELAQANRDGVAGKVGVRVVVGQLEAGDDEQVVARPGPLRLALDGLEVGGVARIA